MLLFDTYCLVDNIQLLNFYEVVRLYCGEEYLDIYISPQQGYSIYLGLKGIKPVRPLTHDLFVNLLKVLNLTVKNVTIYDLKNGIYMLYCALKIFV